jgi:hypothetical protein
MVELVIAGLVLCGVHQAFANQKISPAVITVAAKQGVIEVENSKSHLFRVQVLLLKAGIIPVPPCSAASR